MKTFDRESGHGGADRRSLPHRDHLERVFRADLSSVESVTSSASVRDAGARGAASHDTVAFAETLPPIGLVAHEVAHVLQHRTGAPPAPSYRAEGEARQARAHVEQGRPGPFPIRSGPAAEIQLDTGGDGSEPAPKPLASPFAAQIEAEHASGKAPGSVPYKLTLTVPGEAGGPAEKRTIELEKPVLGATMVTAYAVPLDRLYATQELAAKARRAKDSERTALSIIGDELTHGAPVIPKSKPKPPAPPPPAKTGVAAKVDSGSTTPTTGKVAEVGPPPDLASQKVYDIFGEPVTLVARAGNWGVTTEFTKISVGAASCGVLRTATGITLIDAGVRQSGFPDPGTVDYAMKRLRELVVTETGAKAPIENLLITHVHLDHIGLLEPISKEFVIKKITINAAQANDSAFRDAVAKIVDGQREIHRKQIESEIEKSERAKWEASDAAKGEFAEGVKEVEFKKHLDAEVEARLRKVPAIEIEVLVPAGPGGAEVAVKLGGVDIVRKPATKGPGGGYTAKDAFGVTVLDPSFEEAAKRQSKAAEAAGDTGEARLPKGDTLSSNYLLELPDGTRLLITSDVRTLDIVNSAKELTAAIKELGAAKGVTLVDIAHHFQSGFLGEAHGGAPRIEANGIMTTSQLARLTETISKLAQNKGAFAVTSAEGGYIDPAVVYLLESCGIRVMPALGATDVQFIAAVTAKGEPVAGFSSGEPLTVERTALLQRTDAVLDKLKAELEAAELRVAEEKEAQRQEARERAEELALERQPIEAEIARLQADYEKARTAAEKPPPGAKHVPRSLISARATALKTVNAERAKLKTAQDDAATETKNIEERVGPMEEARRDLVRQINEIQQAREALLTKVKASSLGPKDAKPAVDPDRFAAEEKVLADKVDPLFEAGVKDGTFTRIGETSLVVLGKNVQRTDANAELLDAWESAYKARVRASSPEATIGDQIRLVEELQKLREIIAKRPDIADQKAVEHELEFIDEQIKQSTELVKQAADKVGTTTTERSPLTGETYEQKLIPEKTVEEAQAETAPEAESKFAKGVNATANVVGRGLGALMVIQNIKGASHLHQLYTEGKANFAETTVGVAKSAYGITIGARMLKGVHVGAGEFILISALDVAQALLGDYTSTAEFDTEVTYALIRAGVNAALMMVGMYLMSLGPWGVIAGMLVMFIGDPLLELLGIKAWLAKKFDPRPDEMIELDEELNGLLASYAKTIGETELQAEKDVDLQGFGADDPKAVRDALSRRLQEQRWGLLMAEYKIVQRFEAAYDRAREGYMGLKWLDDQRARFAKLFLKVHEGDDIPGGVDVAGQVAVGDIPEYLSKKGVMNALQKTEEIVALDKLTVSGVYEMEQWKKIDKRIGELEDLLYHTGYDPSNYDNIDWMKVFEASSMLEQMIANARYRLEPDKQGTHRVKSLLPAGEVRDTYEQLLVQKENKADVLRQRQLDMSMGGGMPSGVKHEGAGYTVGRGTWGQYVINYEADTYYEPEYGNFTVTPSEAALLERADKVVLYYVNLIMVTGELPEGVTVETLHSSPQTIQKYKDALRHDADYQDRMFRLQATRAATVGTMERAHRLLDGKATAKAKLDELDTKLKEYEHDRKLEYGYYLPEEVDELMGRVGTAHSTMIAEALGEAKGAKQMSAMEHAALTDDEIKKFHLSTLRDRVMEAAIELPATSDAVVQRMYRLLTHMGAYVGVKPGVSSRLEQAPPYGQFELFIDVIPLNDAAIAVLGTRGSKKMRFDQLLPVKLSEIIAPPKAEP